MKKISLIFAFVALVIAMFAINAFAVTEPVTADDIESIVASEGNEAAGNVWNLVDGNVNSSGIYVVGSDWCGAIGETVTITFKKELMLTNITGYYCGNYTFSVLTAKDASGNTTVNEEQKGILADNGDSGQVALSSLDVSEADAVAVKTITIKITGLNWNGNIKTHKISEISMQKVFVPVADAIVENVAGKADDILNDGTTKVDTDYLKDGNYNTASSIENTNGWVNYHFMYNNGITVSKVVVVVNSTGKVLYKDANGDEQVIHEYTELSNLGSIFCRLYNANNEIVYQLNSVPTTNATVMTDANGKEYAVYTFDLGGSLYAGVHKVEVATLGRDAQYGVWEVEIYNYKCADESHHNFAAATCATPATCIYCGTTTGEVSAEHTGTMSEATCTKLSKCSVCGGTTGELDPDNHVWKDATCKDPKTCTECGLTEGEPTGEHTWVDVSCAAPKHCSGCGLTEGEALPHGYIYRDGNCATGDKCSVCNTVAVEAISHTLDSNGYCTNDGCYYRDIEENIASNATVTAGPSSWWAVKTQYLTDGKWHVGTHAPQTAPYYYTFTYDRARSFSRFVVVVNGYVQTPADGKSANNDAVIGVKVTLKDDAGNVVYESNAFNINGETALEIDLPCPINAYSATFTFTSTERWGSSFVKEIEIYEPAIAGCYTHNFEQVITDEPTCEAEGKANIVCTVCEAVESVIVVPAKGHTMSEEYETIYNDCVSAPVYQFACTVCGKTDIKENHVDNIIDTADKSTIETPKSGGGDTAATMFDGNLETGTRASGAWAVEGSISFDRAYYLSSVTIWIEGGSTDAGFIVFYQAPGSDEWVRYNETAMQVPAPWGRVSEYTLELTTPVYADAIKVYVGAADYNPRSYTGLSSYSGMIYEVAVEGSLTTDTAKGHTWAVAGDAVAPTCVAYGYTPYKCTDCDATREGDFVYETGNHIYNVEVEGTRTDATCTENGSVTMKCETCDKTQNQTLKALGHTEGEVVVENSVAAGCETTGSYDNVVYCTVCNAELSRENVTVDALGHTEGEAVVENSVAAGCETTGSYDNVVYCTVCNTELSRETVAVEATGHNYEAVVTAPDCVNDGYTTYTCTACGNSYVDNYVDATGHNYTEETVEPTCTEEGYVKSTCSVCGEVAISDEKTPALGHSYDLSAATTVDNVITVPCSNECGAAATITVNGTTAEAVFNMMLQQAIVNIYTPNYGTLTFEATGASCNMVVNPMFPAQPITSPVTVGLDAYNTSFTLIPSFDATADAPSIVVTYTELTPATIVIGDNTVSTSGDTKIQFVAPTDGQYIFTSEADVYVLDEYGSTSISEGAFKFEEGQVVYLIIHPYGAESVAINAVEFVCEHNYEETVYDPSCISGGFTVFECSECGDKYIGNETPALGHSYVEAERVPAEPGVAGSVTYTCSICGDTYSETIEALPEEHTHTPVEIPAVPSVQDINKVVTPGKTSGVMCADCGTILVAPADVPVDFAIPGLAISLTADINAIYRVTIPKGYKDAYMTFKLEGLDEVVVTDSFIEGARTVFQFQGLKFYMMNEEITATVYATTENGQTAILNHSTMSVKFYATQIFKNYASVPSQQKLITLISDLLIAGDMTQIYHGHDVNNLVSDAVKAEGYTLKPTKALADVVIDSYSYGYSENNDRTAPLGWNGMQLVIENSVVMLFKFNATGADLEGLQIKVTIGNNAPTIYNLTDENISYDAQGRCVITVNNIKAKEYGETVKVSFVRDGVDVVNGPEAYLSINAYLSLQQNSTAESGKLKNITRALYNYGQSVYAYEN